MKHGTWVRHRETGELGQVKIFRNYGHILIQWNRPQPCLWVSGGVLELAHPLEVMATVVTENPNAQL